MGPGRSGTCVFPLPSPRGVECEVEKADLSASGGRWHKVNRGGFKDGVWGVEEVIAGWSPEQRWIGEWQVLLYMLFQTNSALSIDTLVSQIIHLTAGRGIS